MPRPIIKQLSREAYFSAPPIESKLRPPRVEEVRWPRAPLRMPDNKAENSSMDSVEDAPDFDYNFKPNVEYDCKPRIPFDP